jgi:hypothetical protein
MNLARGLFRLWLVFSALFATGTACWFYPSVVTAFEKAAARKPQSSVSGTLLVPLDRAGPLRGLSSEDRTHIATHGPWELLGGKPVEICWYQLPTFRAVFPAYNDLTDDELAEKLYAKAGVGAADPWWKIATATLVGFGVPFTTLLIGAAFFWVGEGFRRRD